MAMSFDDLYQLNLSGMLYYYLWPRVRKADWGQCFHFALLLLFIIQGLL